jgi:hypothetical protein
MSADTPVSLHVFVVRVFPNWITISEMAVAGKCIGRNRV